jgi:hypothetical protein
MELTGNWAIHDIKTMKSIVAWNTGNITESNHKIRLWEIEIDGLVEDIDSYNAGTLEDDEFDEVYAEYRIEILQDFVEDYAKSVELSIITLEHYTVELEIAELLEPVIK